MSWRKFLMIPQLIYYGVGAPKSQAAAWERYWGGIAITGPDGQVLWDADSPAELAKILDRIRGRLDPSLRLVDVGCGNGRFSRAFAVNAPAVLGLDASKSAIRRAREEARSQTNVSYRVIDITAPTQGALLHSEFGDVNVHIRGVLHVLDHQGRLRAIENLRAMLGKTGSIYLCETNIVSPLDHLEFQGATATTMPDPLRRCIEAGIRPPARFGAREVETYFPTETWRSLLAGPDVMHGVSLHAGRAVEDIPSYFAILQPRA